MRVAAPGLGHARAFSQDFERKRFSLRFNLIDAIYNLELKSAK
jgi:hypothetical protein